eukprot:CAMPEP_0184978310 /NCGR_PEP_ID=MMETSP1098-20130426/8848_1 /TAXON_ID=89044 /ORGANISM="Spumella elongata, Strain CCAP 955/1" /LENGTH=369 /DNA_ID=CAMNT_0027501431 /DNA_START=41 /DNA_END=1150 /DNA_ORIENTATION=+
MTLLGLVASSCLATSVLAASSSKMVPRDQFPQIISHRGASGYVPEHSLQAYQLAIDLKTDYIEPDLCLSKDGVFVVLHDLLLDDVTNVAEVPKFASKKSTKLVEGKNMTGFFVSDFLYEEIEELFLKQRLPERTTLFNGVFKLPTFKEVMSMAHSQYESSGRLVGIYPELKHPGFFNSLGFHMEDMFLAELTAGGFDAYGPEVANNIIDQVVPVVVQCFENATLSYLRSKTTLPLIYLMNKVDNSWYTQANIDAVATFATGLGAEKNYFANVDYSTAVSTIKMIHDAKLALVPWTFRADQDINARFHGDFALENMYYYCCLGVDGVFTEFPDRSREVVDMMSNYTQWVASANLPVPTNQPLCNLDCASV